MTINPHVPNTSLSRVLHSLLHFFSKIPQDLLYASSSWELAICRWTSPLKVNNDINLKLPPEESEYGIPRLLEAPHSWAT